MTCARIIPQPGSHSVPGIWITLYIMTCLYTCVPPGRVPIVLVLAGDGELWHWYFSHMLLCTSLQAVILIEAWRKELFCVQKLIGFHICANSQHGLKSSIFGTTKGACIGAKVFNSILLLKNSVCTVLCQWWVFP